MVIMKELINTVDIVIIKHDILYTYFNNKITFEKSNSNWLGCKILKSCEIADIVPGHNFL